jgi:hypothetical protein
MTVLYAMLFRIAKVMSRSYQNTQSTVSSQGNVPITLMSNL